MHLPVQSSPARSCFLALDIKQQRVAEEFRADLLGHGGKTETTERYCNPIGIRLQLEELMKLPILTAHLERVMHLL